MPKTLPTASLRFLGSEPAWFRKRAEKEKMNKEIQVGQEEIPGPFLLPENNFNRKG
jgi:hypothetical protein